MNTSRYSENHIHRAKVRSQQAAWAGLCAKLMRAATEFKSSDYQRPEFDASWYRADVPYVETYKNFHQYVRGVRPFHVEMNRQLLCGIIFDNDLWRRQVVDLVLSWGEGIDFRVTHYDSGMEYTHLAGPLCDILLGAKDLMSADEVERGRSCLRRAADAIVRCSEIWRTELKYMPFNNHRMSHMSALLASGYVLNDSDLVEPVFDPLDDRSFLNYLDGAIYDDGLCYESSSMYHYATVSGLCATAMVQAALFPERTDLFSLQGSYGRSLCDYLKGPLATCFRDQERPRLGDCYGYDMKIQEAFIFLPAYEATGEPIFAKMAGSLARESLQGLMFAPDEHVEVELPEAHSQIFPEHGYALLRDEAIVHKQAFLSGDRSGIHHQRDGLQLQVEFDDSIVLYCTDIKPTAQHGFSDSIHEDFNRWPHAHSQLQIDDLDQKTYRSPIPIREWNANAGAVKRMAMVDEHQALQDDVHQGRFVSMQDDWICDCVIADSNTSRSWRLFYHLPSGEAMSSAFSKAFAVVHSDSKPWSYLDIEAGSNSSAMHAWTSGNTQFQLASVNPVTLQKFSIQHSESQRMPGIYAEQRGQQAVYVTLITRSECECRIEGLRVFDAGDELMARWSIVRPNHTVHLQSRILKV